MIGEKLTSLEYLELSFKVMKAEVAMAELKKYLPGLRGVIKEVQDDSIGSVKKIVKI
jgi:hypothetical protein